MVFDRKYFFVLIIVFAIIGNSCSKDSACFKGTGKIEKEQRSVSAEVTRIVAEDNVDLVITQSNVTSLVVEGGANLLPYINTTVSGNVLSISSDNKCSMFRDNTIPITAYLSIPNLTQIEIAGQGNISCANTLNFPKFSIESSGGTGSIHLAITSEDLSVVQNSGPADFTLTGEVENLYAYTLGNGWFYLENLLAEKAHVSQNGSGDIYVNVLNELKVELRSRGNIIYRGTPALNVTEHSGSGAIIQQ